MLMLVQVFFYSIFFVACAAFAIGNKGKKKNFTAEIWSTSEYIELKRSEFHVLRSKWVETGTKLLCSMNT